MDQELLRSILESSTHHSIIASALDGTIVAWNEGARRAYGYEPGAVVGVLNVDALHDPADVAAGRARAALETALAEGVWEGELTRMRQNGERFLAQVTVTVRRGTDGAPVGFTIVSRDLTGERRVQRAQNEELEEQYRRVQQANRLKSEFLANMSHELRTPLNGIIGFTELIHDGKIGPEEQQEYLGDILTSSRHLLQLINDILDLSKIEAGKMEFRPEPVHVPTVLGEVCDTLRAITAQKAIIVNGLVAPPVTNVLIDAGRLRQVLYNFLSNAVKFTPEGGRVTIRFIPAGDAAFSLEVEDTGIGIEADDVPKLFNEFAQLDGGTTKRYAGTGLGLALTRRLVEAQGGRVGVRSIRGQGSTFFAVLPRMAPTAVPEGPPLAARPAVSGPVPLVLIVEDDTGDRRWIAETLARAGYAVEMAASGREALARCRAQKFDAITLDLLLPDVPGQQVLAELRTAGPNQETPVLVASVMADRGLAVGFKVHDIIGKPLESGLLLASLERAGVTPNTPQPVLIVDDDPQALKLAERTLRQLGYFPICRADGEGGLDAAAEAPPAAVVLDLIMPGMTGFEFLERFRRTRHGRTTPVIIWTAKELSRMERTRLEAMSEAIVAKARGQSALLAELRHLAPGRVVTHAVDVPE